MAAMLNRRTLAALALASSAALAGLTGCARETAPAVDYVLLDGSQVSSQQWAGKVMLVNFWATSCATCVKEMPDIVATHQKFKARGYDTLAVAMSYDPPAFVARFAENSILELGVVL